MSEIVSRNATRLEHVFEMYEEVEHVWNLIVQLFEEVHQVQHAPIQHLEWTFDCERLCSIPNALMKTERLAMSVRSLHA